MVLFSILLQYSTSELNEPLYNCVTDYWFHLTFCWTFSVVQYVPVFTGHASSFYTYSIRAKHVFFLKNQYILKRSSKNNEK